MKKKAVLTRLETSNQGTFGVLTLDSHKWFTGELPWKGNQSQISCIPKGLYFANWQYSPRFKKMMFGIGPVEGRSGIRIHPANLMGDASKGYRAQLNGCIALGQAIGVLDGQKAVLLSKPAVRQFEALLRGESFELEIRGVC